MNAAKRKELQEKESWSLPKSESLKGLDIVHVRDAQAKNIRCVVDKKRGIHYINELAAKDAITILMN